MRRSTATAITAGTSPTAGLAIPAASPPPSPSASALGRVGGLVAIGAARLGAGWAGGCIVAARRALGLLALGTPALLITAPPPAPTAALARLAITFRRRRAAVRIGTRG
jgi:hypothetical protein